MKIEIQLRQSWWDSSRHKTNLSCSDFPWQVVLRYLKERTKGTSGPQHAPWCACQEAPSPLHWARSTFINVLPHLLILLLIPKHIHWIMTISHLDVKHKHLVQDIAQSCFFIVLISLFTYFIMFSHINPHNKSFWKKSRIYFFLSCDRHWLNAH